MAVITLLTDFGIEDEYVGLMKGVILAFHPSATIVDITHHIDPQDIVQAAYLIRCCYSYFPRGTIHLVVVDPGVGSDRSIIAVQTEKYCFVAPNNGVLTFVFDAERSVRIVRVADPAYFLHPVSDTFHGRDIFAPVGAHLGEGLDIRRLGPDVDGRFLVRVKAPEPYLSSQGELVGEVVWIDRFGNLITNVDSNRLHAFRKAGPEKRLGISVRSLLIEGLSGRYGDVAPKRTLALIGSRGYLEIAVNCGSARQRFKAEKGDAVKLIRL